MADNEDAKKRRLTIAGPLPPSTNKLYKNLPPDTMYIGGLKQGGRGRALTGEAKKYKRALNDHLWAMTASSLAPPYPYSVNYHFRFPDARRRDISNQIKLIEDVVFRYLGSDDSLVYDFHVWKYIDRKDPGFVMEVRHCSRSLE
jgi:Holliday junction resolvase RusA-like endonuclease